MFPSVSSARDSNHNIHSVIYRWNPNTKVRLSNHHALMSCLAFLLYVILTLSILASRVVIVLNKIKKYMQKKEMLELTLF